ncbi:hypothetical protein Lal_00015952 [Lupinus albus]|nr:hypothetical protein Lal_00015952 [Lupinus albus]
MVMGKKCPRQNEAKKESKKAISEGKNKAYDELYKYLERSVQRLSNGRERKTRDLDKVKSIKVEDVKVLMNDKDVKEMWKNYFHKFFNEGPDSLLSNILHMKEGDRNYTFYCGI